MKDSVLPVEVQSQAKLNLLGLDREAMQGFCQSIGEQSFRASQIMKWIHQQGVVDFSDMTNLSKSLREALAETSEIALPELLQDDLSRLQSCQV